MLYVTTRNHLDTFTVQHALTENRGEDGGLYLPLHFPLFSRKEQDKLAALSINQCVAEILNRFFTTKLTGWDIDFTVGRYPVRIKTLAHRVYMAETWHNPDRKYHRFENILKELLQAETDLPGNWVSIAVKMAVLAGILGNREIWGTEPVDIAVVSGNFTDAISAWYLRKMGFPIGNIICCCNENNQFWDLICNGQMRTDAVSLSTIVPEADLTLPVDLERLIADCGGTSETKRYLEHCGTGSVYTVSDTMLRQLRDGLYVSVVSSSRVETTIPNVYRTHKYVLSPADSLAYCGLLDYRTKTAITRPAVILSDHSFICDADTVAKAMDIPLAELKTLI